MARADDDPLVVERNRVSRDNRKDVYFGRGCRITPSDLLTIREPNRAARRWVRADNNCVTEVACTPSRCGVAQDVRVIRPHPEARLVQGGRLAPYGEVPIQNTGISEIQVIVTSGQHDV